MNEYLLNSHKGNILIVDDIPDNLRVLSASLKERGYQIRCAKNGTMALLTSQKEPPDLILLDIKMPDMDGYEVCQKLKAEASTREIPVIFLSALDDVFDKVKAFAVGGVDYITKPFQIEEILVRIQHQLALREAKAKIIQLNEELEEKVRERTAQLEEVIQQLHQEVDRHKKTQNKLFYQALHDALTELPNRTLFMEHLHKTIQRNNRHKNSCFAVLFIDLDRFKTINDTWGHGVGDRLLIAVANILKECCREVDTVARLSGDEFTILLEDLQDIQDAISIVERILAKLNSPIYIDDRQIFSGASIGIVFSSPNYRDGMELMRDADIAMYRAKAAGKGCYAIFDREMYAETTRLSQLETDLHLALENQSFFLEYQPIVSLKTKNIIGLEALLRWRHPKRGLISPAEFIPIAEDSGSIVSIGEWVLQSACQQLSLWQQKFSRAQSLYISINLSSKQIEQNDFVDRLVSILNETNLLGENIRLELTETMLMDRSNRTVELLHRIKEQNVQLSIDDFGTGYSSLSYLHTFPIDALKIDRSFVSAIDSDNKNSEIVKTTISLAHSLGMQSIAEGVETSRQLECLKDLGCDAVQGYLIAKPLKSTSVESFLSNIGK